MLSSHNYHSLKYHIVSSIILILATSSPAFSSTYYFSIDIYKLEDFGDKESCYAYVRTRNISSITGAIRIPKPYMSFYNESGQLLEKQQLDVNDDLGNNQVIDNTITLNLSCTTIMNNEFKVEPINNFCFIDGDVVRNCPLTFITTNTFAKKEREKQSKQAAKKSPTYNKPTVHQRQKSEVAKPKQGFLERLAPSFFKSDFEKEYIRGCKSEHKFSDARCECFAEKIDVEFDDKTKQLILNPHDNMFALMKLTSPLLKISKQCKNEGR